MSSDLLVKLHNSLLIDFVGLPFNLSRVSEQGGLETYQATLSDAVLFFLRYPGADGRNLIVKSADDSERARTLGISIRSANHYLEIAKGEHKWLMAKAKELAWQAFPTDAPIFVEALENEAGGCIVTIDGPEEASNG
jgi:hypothetical protein